FSVPYLPLDRYLDVRMDWEFHRQLLSIFHVVRAGSHKKVLKVNLAGAPLPELPGDNHYYDTHFHSIAEWFFASPTDVFAPRKAYGGPIVMAVESAYAIGMIDSPASVRDLVCVTDHNCFYNTQAGSPNDSDRLLPYGPSSPSASTGLVWADTLQCDHC